MNKIIYPLILSTFLFSGCGDKIVKMNDYSDIKYSYHPTSSYELESKTYKELSSDSNIESKMKRNAKKIDTKTNEFLNDIINNQDNSNIMQNQSNNRINSRPNKDNLFKDRFDNLQLNR